MEQPHFVDLGDVDMDSVDTEAAPMSAEHYLKQVAAARHRMPSVVSVEVLPSGQRPTTSQMNKKSRDPLAPSREWQVNKANDFSEKRAVFDSLRLTIKKTKVNWPSPMRDEKWENLIFFECVPGVSEEEAAKFPQHKGTPPTLGVVNSMGPVQAHCLLPYLVEWAQPESESDSEEKELIDENVEPQRQRDSGLTVPIRQWIYTTLLLIEKPLLQDVVAAIRQLAKMCKEERRKLGENTNLDEEQKTRLVYEYSFFVAVVSIYFGQSDLSDDQ